MDPHRISITIIGDGGVGKSALTLRLVKSQWTSDYDPTIEDSYTLTRRIDGQTYHLSITDTAGQEEYRGMWASANLKSDAFLLVYDITSARSLESLCWFDELVVMEGEMRGEGRREGRLAGKEGGNAGKGWGGGLLEPVKIVAGNKCDLQGSREVSAQKGLEWARGRGCGFMETSARSRVNIEETFALIVRRVVEGRRKAEREWERESSWGYGGGDEDGDGDNGGLGTSRAMTKPLTPLPGDGADGEGDEKRGSPGANGKGKGRRRWRWREFRRMFRCWKWK